MGSGPLGVTPSSGANIERPAVDAELVDVLLDERRQGGSAPMPGVAEGEQEKGAASRGFSLEPGDYLQWIVRRRGLVVHRRREGHDGEARLGPDIVVGRVPREVGAFDRGLGRAVLDGRRAQEAEAGEAQHVE